MSQMIEFFGVVITAVQFWKPGHAQHDIAETPISVSIDISKATEEDLPRLLLDNPLTGHPLGSIIEVINKTDHPSYFVEVGGKLVELQNGVWITQLPFETEEGHSIVVYDDEVWTMMQLNAKDAEARGMSYREYHKGFKSK